MSSPVHLPSPATYPYQAQAQRIKQVMREQQLSGGKLAQELGVTEKTVSVVATGRRPLSLRLAVRFRNRFGYRVLWLRDGHGLPTEAADRAQQYAPDTVANWLVLSADHGPQPAHTSLVARTLVLNFSAAHPAHHALLVAHVARTLDTLAALLLHPPTPLTAD